MNSFTKEERLCSKTAISRLLSKGRYGNVPGLRFCFLVREEGGINRLLISVPKKNFKRAVRRNLLKRRLREAYRTLKSLLPEEGGIDLMLIYTSKEILDYQTIRASVTEALTKISAR